MLFQAACVGKKKLIKCCYYSTTKELLSQCPNPPCTHVTCWVSQSTPTPLISSCTWFCNHVPSLNKNDWICIVSNFVMMMLQFSGPWYAVARLSGTNVADSGAIRAFYKDDSHITVYHTGSRWVNKTSCFDVNFISGSSNALDSIDCSKGLEEIHFIVCCLWAGLHQARSDVIRQF